MVWGYPREYQCDEPWHLQEGDSHNVQNTHEVYVESLPVSTGLGSRPENDIHEFDGDMQQLRWTMEGMGAAKLCSILCRTILYGTISCTLHVVSYACIVDIRTERFSFYITTRGMSISSRKAKILLLLLALKCRGATLRVVHTWADVERTSAATAASRGEHVGCPQRTFKMLDVHSIVGDKNQRRDVYGEYCN